MGIEPGFELPALTLPASGGRQVSLRGQLGAPLVLYFYPKDNTPGCTMEAQDFAALYPQFREAGAEVFGVSRDSPRSHDNFCTRYGLPFLLLSDADEALCRALDVIREKSRYGRKYLGVDRSTFLFGADGKLVRQWRSVKVKAHAAEVLDAVRSL